MSSTRCSALVLLLVMVLGAGVAGAQPAVGKMHFERGLQLYRAGKYADAIGEFESGYAALPRPAFLLNIAQSWRKLGDLGWARLYYQRFVDQAEPNDPARQQALAAIALIDVDGPTPKPKAKPIEPATAPPPAAEPTPPVTVTPPPPAVVTPPPAVVEPPPPQRSRTPGWVGVGAGVLGLAAIGVGAGLVVDAQALDRRYVHPADGATYDPNLPRQRDLERDVAVGLFAGGGALVAVGAVLAAIYLPPPKAPSRHALALRPLWAPTAVGASFAGSF